MLNSPLTSHKRIIGMKIVTLGHKYETVAKSIRQPILSVSKTDEWEQNSIRTRQACLALRSVDYMKLFECTVSFFYNIFYRSQLFPLNIIKNIKRDFQINLPQKELITFNNNYSLQIKKELLFCSCTKYFEDELPNFWTPRN